MSSISVQPDLVRLRRRAKDIQRAAKSSDPESLAFLSAHAPGVDPLKLTTSQLSVARSEGFDSWSAAKRSAEDDATRQLFDAAEAGDVPSASALLRDYPACAKRRSAGGPTLLHACVWANDPEMVRVLLAAGAPRDALWGDSAHTPLSWATTVGSQRVAAALLEAGASPDLFTAAGLGDIERVKSFWVDGKLAANPSRTGSSRFDADGNKLPRPPSTAEDQVSDALYLASRSGHADVARWLLDHGADPNFRGYEGATSLHWAEFANDASLCRMLREAGGSDELISYGFKATPRAFGIICPAAYGMVDRLRARLESHPEDVNIAGGFGTALNAAVWNNQLDCVAILLEHGADPDLKNAAGLTVLELADSRGFNEIAEILRNAEEPFGSAPA